MFFSFVEPISSLFFSFFLPSPVVFFLLSHLASSILSLPSSLYFTCLPSHCYFTSPPLTTTFMHHITSCALFSSLLVIFIFFTISLISPYSPVLLYLWLLHYFSFCVQLQAFESICNNKSELSSTPSSSSKKNSNNQKKPNNLISQTNILNNLKVNGDYTEKDTVSGSGKINGQEGRLNSCSIDSSHSSFSNLTLPSTSS